MQDIRKAKLTLKGDQTQNTQRKKEVPLIYYSPARGKEFKK